MDGQACIWGNVQIIKILHQSDQLDLETNIWLDQEI